MRPRDQWNQTANDIINSFIYLLVFLTKHTPLVSFEETPK